MKFVDETEVKNKKVLVRADFNVDLGDNGEILSDFRIRAVLPTIKYLIEHGASKIILISHLGKPKGKDEKLSLKNIAKILGDYLGKDVLFLSDCIGEEIKNNINQAEVGRVILLENLRFYDAEEKNDEKFAKLLASLADIYVNDAFGVCHRANSSVLAIVKELPSFGGLLLKKEIENLNRAIQNVAKPLVLVLGGAKISTKLPLIKRFSNFADLVLLGGALVNTILKAWKLNVGKSLVEDDMLLEAEKIKADKAEILMPGDLLVGDLLNATSSQVKKSNAVLDGEWILDIGPEAEKIFSEAISKAGTIIWNGPMGYFENPVFENGTKKIAQAIANSSAFSIVGGGETLTVLEKFKLFDKMSFVSTGGGAMLSYLAGEEMPGIKALN